jgi:uncharacterized spore protein YtfJ
VARPATPRELTRFLARLGGGRLVYGKPVRAGEHTLVPVARVRLAGGFGFGSQPDEEGGGGGGLIAARPVGFIEVSPDGVRYEAISSRNGRVVAIAAGVAAGVVAGSAIAGSAVGAAAVRRLARVAAPTARRAARWSSRRGRLPSPLRSLRR